MHNTYILIRHGISEVNESDRIISGIENSRLYPLTDKGRGQVLRLSERISQVHVLFTSPLERTRESADLISQRHNISYYMDRRLREREMGDLEGKYWNEANEFMSNTEGTEWTETKANKETFKQVWQRMSDFYQDVEQTYTDRTIGIVSHGDCLTVLYRWLQGEAAEVLSPYSVNSRYAPFRIGEWRICSLIDEKKNSLVR